MNKSAYFALAAAFAVMSACGKSEPAANEGVPAVQNQATQGQVYSGTGTIQSIAGDQIAIAHGPIEGIGWPAMTMTFTAPAGVAEAVAAGNQVDFSFRQDGGTYVLSSLRKR
jgi:Cu(I)/Ag(I) efflux system protein CusF